jgi:hypothetical protein
MSYFDNFDNPFPTPRNVPEKYRQHPALQRLFVSDDAYLIPAEGPVQRWAVYGLVDRISAEYLHTILRLSTTLEQFGRRSARTSYPALLENDIRVILTPVPDEKIQEKIVVEVTNSRTQATQLRQEAKARVERVILGEETP